MRFPRKVRQNEVLARARWATAAFFFVNGAVTANLLPRLPEVKATYHLTDDIYGLTVAALPVGAILAGLTAGWFTRRFGAVWVAIAGTALTALSLLAASLMPVAVLFGICLALAGAADAITDVAQNSHGLEVQRRYGRSIINGFHAVWSIGAVCGGLMAAVAVAWQVPLHWHLLVSGILAVALVLAVRGDCLPTGRAAGEWAEDDHSSAEQPNANPSAASDAKGGAQLETHPLPTRARSITYLVLLALVLIATSGAMVEDMANSWATLYLGRDLGAATSLAAVGFPLIAGSQFVGRMLGDTMVNRWGYRRVARAGAALIILGVGAAVTFTTVPVTLLGFAAAGFGSATLVPAAMHAADGLANLRPGAGLTIVSWLMRLGFLLTPPAVGAIATATSLRWGLAVVAGGGVVTFLLAQVLPGLTPARDVLGSNHD